MASHQIESFREGAGGLTTIHGTAVADFPETLQAAITEPAVGTTLPFEGVSLAETAVETDLSPGLLRTAATGVTPATQGIASTGTITLHTDDEGSELVSLYHDRHVAVLPASAIVADLGGAFEGISEEIGTASTSQVLATGPSATADMGTLVHGVHGPHDVHVIVLEDR